MQLALWLTKMISENYAKLLLMYVNDCKSVNIAIFPVVYLDVININYEHCIIAIFYMKNILVIENLLLFCTVHLVKTETHTFNHLLELQLKPKFTTFSFILKTNSSDDN